MQWQLSLPDEKPFPKLMQYIQHLPTDEHIRLFDTSNGQFKLFRDIRARDIGWSIIDTDYRYVQLCASF